ncbi:MAG: secretin and TonB N-terminal domain-containing protein [Candidatus Omnitrophica bacterium]|nr:secretin and TonB N-terminal domain-containing protein [Candidatus Omnitrophota bacterium]
MRKELKFPKQIFVKLILGLIFYSVLSASFAQEGILDVLKFKDADIRVVLQAIAEKATISGKKVNIVVGPDVKGLITVDFENVYWETALRSILKTQGYGYELVGENIIMVTTLENLAENRKKEAEAAQQEPLETVTYQLKFLDANDVKNLISNQLTSRGKITVLDIEPQIRWKARGGVASVGANQGGTFTQATKEEGAKPRTKTLVITDTKSNLRNILEAIEKIDVMPKQVLIEARIMEVNRDRLKDLGIDWGTGNSVTSGNLTTQAVDKSGKGNVGEVGVIGLTSQETPSIFNPKTGTSLSGVWPYDTGLSILYKKLTGTEFQILLHALEEDVDTNTLSSPRIITLDGQEAYIMVGEKRPIIKSQIEASENSVGISKELNYYQNLGIELNVIPYICSDDTISMTIYPSVTSSSENIPAVSQIGTSTTTDYYPIILVRETQTQVLMKDGETIVIGGLLKDVKNEGIYKTPILGDIPIFGLLFRRKTIDSEKIDLVIFITAKIIKSSEETLPLDTNLDTKG